MTHVRRTRVSERRNAGAIDASAAAHVAMIKRFLAFAVTIGLLAAVISTIIAVKSLIWIPHFNP